MPVDLALLIERIEASARAQLHDLRTALADQSDLRERFLPDDARQIWRITGSASFGIWWTKLVPVTLRPRREEM